MSYGITWTFDVDEDSTLADGSPVNSPEAAALYAWESFTRNGSIAHVFTVREGQDVHEVDLDESGALPDPAERTVVVSGNPFDGMHLTGPFTDSATANNYAEDHVEGDWWTVNIEAPRD